MSAPLFCLLSFVIYRISCHLTIPAHSALCAKSFAVCSVTPFGQCAVMHMFRVCTRTVANVFSAHFSVAHGFSPYPLRHMSHGLFNSLFAHTSITHTAHSIALCALSSCLCVCVSVLYVVSSAVHVPALSVCLKLHLSLRTLVRAYVLCCVLRRSCAA